MKLLAGEPNLGQGLNHFCIYLVNMLEPKTSFLLCCWLRAYILSLQQQECLGELLCERAPSLRNLKPSCICKCHISDAFKTQIVTNVTL